MAPDPDCASPQAQQQATYPTHSPSRPEPPRPVLVPLRRYTATPAPIRTITQRELLRGKRKLRVVPDYERPVTRADCVEGLRPCPYVGCRHNLFLEVEPSGSIRFNFPGLDFDEIPHTCALDVAEAAGATLEEVGDAINVTRERVRQIEEKAVALLRLGEMGPGGEAGDAIEILREGDDGGRGAPPPDEDMDEDDKTEAPPSAA